MRRSELRFRPSGSFTGAAVLASLVAAALTAGCDSVLGPGPAPGPLDPITELPRALTQPELRTIEASNAFGLELLRRVAAEDPGATVFLSPLSASMALGMAMNGAAGETFDEMRAALRFGDLDEAEINEAYLGLLELLEDLDRDVALRVANSIWYRPDYTLVPAFRERVEAFFRATVRPFAAEAPEEEINRWVREATEGRIDEIAPSPLPGNVAAILLNAVYFQADWTRPFDPEETRPAPFHLPDGSTAEVQLMSMDWEEDTVAVAVTERYAAADLPYARRAFSMTVVVPQGDATVHELLDELDSEGWASLVDGLRPGRAVVEIPRFGLEWEGALDEALRAMGMEAAFESGLADFSRMFQGGGPWIDEVKQKSFLKVDEEGTEAAAVTSVVMVDSAPPTVRADRPFLLAIRERLTGTILFIGAIVEPPME
jgi:serine protease inhibitor